MSVSQERQVRHSYEQVSAHSYTRSLDARPTERSPLSHPAPARLPKRVARQGHMLDMSWAIHSSIPTLRVINQWPKKVPDVTQAIVLLIIRIQTTVRIRQSNLKIHLRLIQD